MAFTFNVDLSDDVSKVRFHIGDTNSGGYYLEDETITALVASEGSVNRAVVSCIQYIIGQLSRPDFEADWLSVDHKTAREGYEHLLSLKRKELSIPALPATYRHVYRGDSDMSEPSYD